MPDPSAAVVAWSQVAANVATAIGVLGVGFAYWQYRAGVQRELQRGATDAWHAHVQLTIQHPQLAHPEEARKALASGGVEGVRYRWFVSSLLFAAERVLEAFPDDAAWQATVERQLRHHAPFLRAKRDVGLEPYTPALVALLARIAGPAATPPAAPAPGRSAE